MQPRLTLLFLAILVLTGVPDVRGGVKFSVTPGSVVQSNAQRAWRPGSESTDSVVSLVVRFRGGPALVEHSTGATGGARAKGMHSSTFNRFASDILQQQMNVKVTRTFQGIFFGATIVAPEDVTPQILALPYVESVFPDREVTAFLDRSVHQIRADKVWTDFGTTGEGVRVGIIDSGIDYFHPALGGGMGPGFKVIGGYDFVNGDNDPMDDYGHGTHVAGIVAAHDSVLRGVAPGVQLMALKVLNAQGRGITSDIISAIELAADPDRDGDPSDHLDILNLSLGSASGNPDDPACIALDNATRIGITCVVAAGNNGRPELVEGKENNYYFDGSETIGSPGMSRCAITVGAVDVNDQMADFSSKGPVTGTFAIKPDVTAPGVDIRSLALSSGYRVSSGTSMATPHVAGVAALIKSLHPSWTPDRIKSAIVATAAGMGNLVMKHGTGRVDAFRAVSTESSIQPTHLSFGLDDPTVSTWMRSDTIIVTNDRSAVQEYTMSVSGVSTGIEMQFSPPTFSLSAGSVQIVVATISVSNAAVPIVPEDIEIYGGQVTVTGTADTLHLPWGCVRASRLLLTFSDPDPEFVGVSPGFWFTHREGDRFVKVKRLSPVQYQIVGTTAGMYDIAALFHGGNGPQRIVLSSGVQLPAAGGEVSIAASTAIHRISLEGVDERGVPLTSHRGAHGSLLMVLPGTRGWLSVGAPVASLPEFLVSPLPPDAVVFGIQSAYDLAEERRWYLPQFPSVHGVSGNVRLSNDPASYVRQGIRMKVPPDRQTGVVYMEQVHLMRQGTEEFSLGGLVAADTVDLGGDATWTGFLSAPHDPTLSAAVAFHLNYTDIAASTVDLSMLPLCVVSDSVQSGLPSQTTTTTYRSPGGDTLTFGGSPVAILNRSYNNSFGPNTIHFDPLFRGALREMRYADISGGMYAIYDNAGSLIRSSPLDDFPRSPLQVGDGVHTLDISSSDYFIQGRRGRVTLRNRFDLSQQIADAPYILSLQILDGRGRQTDGVQQHEHLRLRFASKVIFTPSELPLADSTHVYCRVHGTETWCEVPWTKVSDDPEGEGSVFDADLSSATWADSSAVDIRVVTWGRHGNMADMRLEPAFSVGEWQGGTPTDSFPPPLLPQTFALHQNYPNPFNPTTSIAFEMPSRGLARLSIYDVLGRKVIEPLSGEFETGLHTLSFDATPLATGVYFYRLVVSQDGRTLFDSVRKMMVVK